MITFQMQHGVSLKSGKSIRAFAFYATEDESEIEELREHANNGVCTEVQKKKQEKQEKNKDEDENQDQGQADDTGDAAQNPEEDITTVKGVGASVEGKLAEAGITTVSSLKDAVSSDPEKIKELIGAPSLTRIREHFGFDEQGGE